MIQQDRVVQTFLDLVQIDSPSGFEKEMALETAHRLDELGFTVIFDESAAITGSNTGNVIAVRTGELPEKRIGFSAHLDQVPPCLGVKPIVGEDGVIRSDGTTTLGADDKSGVTAILEGIRAAVESGEHLPTITVFFSVKEEVGLQGSKALDEGYFKPGDLILVADSEETPGNLCIGAPSQYVMKAEFIGKAAHAGVNPQDGNSAIQMAARAIIASPHGRLDHETTANIGIISGGSVGNVVAPSCHVEAECRSLDATKVLQVKDRMTEAFETAAQDADGKVEIEWTFEYAGYRHAEDDKDIVMLLEAAERAGLSSGCGLSGGGSDANILAGKGLRPIVLGTGMSSFHTVDEYIKVEDLVNTARFVNEIIFTIARDS